MPCAAPVIAATRFSRTNSPPCLKGDIRREASVPLEACAPSFTLYMPGEYNKPRLMGKRRSWENSIVLIRRKTRASARGGPAYSSSYYLREQAFTVLFPQLNVRNGSVAMTRVRTPSITAGHERDFPFSVMQ